MGNGSVFVTNKNDDFIHVDSFDGEEFRFPPGDRVLIPVDAAVHMFGYGLADKTDNLVRLGWSMRYDPKEKTYVENPDGVRKLANFVFEEATMVPKTSKRATELGIA